MDRNDVVTVSALRELMSLSARRAWIEIAQDRRVPGRPLSLSARRAWIEICGGVSAKPLAACRSPQGERG